MIFRLKHKRRETFDRKKCYALYYCKSNTIIIIAFIYSLSFIYFVLFLFKKKIHNLYLKKALIFL